MLSECNCIYFRNIITGSDKPLHIANGKKRRLLDISTGGDIWRSLAKYAYVFWPDDLTIEPLCSVQLKFLVKMHPIILW